MRRQSVPWFSTLFALFLVFSNQASAQTDVSGAINGEVWEEGVYRVTGNVSVEALIIEPGAVIEFTGNFGFEVTGILRTIGTPERPVHFRRAEGASGWGGLFFNSPDPESQLRYCIIEGSVNRGIRIDGVSPVISNCTVRGNSSSGFGGGIFTNARLTLTDCTVSGNVATRWGGGIYAEAALVLENCSILRNSIAGTRCNCDVSGGGGGIYAEGSLLSMTNTLVCQNSAVVSNGVAFRGARSFAGGVVSNAETTLLRNCVVSNNVATAGANTHFEQVYGGGVYLNSTDAQLHNCVVSSNFVRSRLLGRQWSPSFMLGSGIHVAGGQARLTNCTVVDNVFGCGSGSCSSSNRIGGIWRNGGTVALENCIVFSNRWEGSEAFSSQIQGTVSASYSDVQGGWAGEGNIGADPRFVPDTFSLELDSPCLDAGNPAPEFNDCDETRNDIGATGGQLGCGADRVGLSAIRPRTGGNTGNVTILLFGFGFTGETSAALVRDDTILEAAATRLLSQLVMRVTFDLTAQEPGDYSLQVSNPSGQMAGGPEPFVVQEGGSARISLQTGATTLVPGRRAHYFVTIENTGTIDAQELELIGLLDPSKFAVLNTSPPVENPVGGLASSLPIWRLGGLAPKERKLVSYQVRIDSSVRRGARLRSPISAWPFPLPQILLPPDIPDVPFPIEEILARLDEFGSAIPLLAECLKNVITTTDSCASCLGPKPPSCNCLPLCIPESGPLELVTCLPCLVVCGACLLKPGPDGGNCLTGVWDTLEECFGGATDFLKELGVPISCKDNEKIVRVPVDPNEMVVTPAGNIRGEETLLYVVHYENVGDADAQTVTIISALDENIDLATLQVLHSNGTFLPISDGESVTLLREDREQRESVDVGDEIIEVVTPHITRWTVELQAGVLTWELQNEFLPPGETDNLVYTVRPTRGLEPGTEIRASAEITFDNFDTLPTNEVVNIIGQPFIRGEVNGDGNIDISDPVALLSFLFLGGPAPSCLDATDANDDGGFQPDISDSVYLLSWLFLGADAPSAPHPACGFDETDDPLGCVDFTGCR